MQLASLRQGDLVDIVAPASRCTAEELRNGVRAVKELGLVPRVPEGLFSSSAVLFSNSDAVRLKQLKAALYARDSKLIWCVRGGYGSLRLLPAMAGWKRPAQAKIVLGYSDITTLHAFLNQKWKWPTLHGPLLDRLGRGTMSAAEKRLLTGMLFGQVLEVEFEGLKPLNSAARGARTVRGVVAGGNMAVLQSSVGTPNELDPRGRILFFEDTGERPHRVDRMLTQFAQAGWFAGAKAVVLGHFLLSDARDRRQLWSDVFTRFAASVKVPVLRGLPVGHDPKQQFTLPLNTPSVLRLGARASLKVESGIL